MTKEQLMAYLPYDLKAQDVNTKEVRKVTLLHFTYDIDTVGHNHLIYDGVLLHKHIPILKPIEDAEKYIRSEFDKHYFGNDCDKDVIELFCYEKIGEIIDFNILEITTLPYDTVQWLLKNHYDVFGLLKENKAVNI